MQENITSPQINKSDLPAKPAADCANCVKKGMPLGKSWLSFLLLLMVGATTVFFVLWVQALRESNVKVTDQVMPDATSETTYVLPQPRSYPQKIDLPEPDTSSQYSVEEALTSRRSRREFAPEPVKLAEVSQLLWAMQGITDDQGHRAAPSAHSLYPFTVYAVVRDVQGLEPGLYAYLPETNQLGSLGLDQAGEMLTQAGVQPGAQNAPVVFVLAGAYGKMVESFPDDPKSVVLLEAGHIGQNAYLQTESLDMSMVVMAGFDPSKVGQALKLDPAETVIYLMPAGHRAAEVAADNEH